MPNVWKRIKRVILNQKRICRLLNINPAVLDDQENKTPEQYVLSVEPLVELRSAIQFTDSTLTCDIIVHKTIEVSLAFGVTQLAGKTVSDSVTVPQHIEASERPQKLTIICKNVDISQVVKNKEAVYLLFAAPGEISDISVGFQALKLSMEHLYDSGKISVIQDVMKVGQNYYEMHKIYGAGATPGSAGANSTLEPSDQDMCCVCLSSRPVVLSLPCRHLILCHECAQSFKDRSQECPLCRAQIECLIELEQNGMSTTNITGTFTSIDLVQKRNDEKDNSKSTTVHTNPDSTLATPAIERMPADKQLTQSIKGKQEVHTVV